MRVSKISNSNVPIQALLSLDASEDDRPKTPRLRLLIAAALAGAVVIADWRIHIGSDLSGNQYVISSQIQALKPIICIINWMALLQPDELVLFVFHVNGMLEAYAYGL